MSDDRNARLTKTINDKMYGSEDKPIDLFELHRDEDETGVSGTGVIAHGVQFPDGTVALRWATSERSTSIWDSIEEMESVHGHNGKTRVVRVESF